MYKFYYEKEITYCQHRKCYNLLD